MVGNLLLAILLISLTGNSSDNQSKYGNLMIGETKINWSSVNATGVLNSADNYHSLSGCVSQANAGIIKLYNSLPNVMPYGIVSGFWSSECDVNISGDQSEKDFFTLADTFIKFKLYSNSPNPFRKQTKIRYDIPKSTRVNLMIYDICGKQIKQLVNENQNIGRYHMTWDGSDRNGKECSAGIYFVSLKTDNYKSIKKILIAK